MVFKTKNHQTPLTPTILTFLSIPSLFHTTKGRQTTKRKKTATLKVTVFFINPLKQRMQRAIFLNAFDCAA